MKIFVLGVPHTQTSLKFTTCAFTMKVWNLCRMMLARGHEVIHIGTGGSNPECSEHIDAVPEAFWTKLYGHPGKNFYNLKTDGEFKPYHDRWAKTCREAIQARCTRSNEAIICCTWGGAQKIATEDLPQFVVESGIGYKFVWAKYKVFESYAWLHMLYGQEKRFHGDGWYDVVIPNSFDPNMFEFRKDKEDWFLYMGRLNDDKGIGIATDVAKRLKKHLKIVGQGEPDRFLKDNPFVTYHPPVGIESRKNLMSRAKAVFAPSRYIEPFAGVAVEAQMSGTPVITTDWGAFSETVCHGYTGFRCRTMEQFLWAAGNVDLIDPQACRDWALQNYSTQRVALMYEEYFQSLLNIGQRGWYEAHPNRTQLDWLRKIWPVSMPLNLDLHHEAPPKVDVWKEAIQWESNWWGLERNEKWDAEEKKQETYARLIGLPADLKLVQRGDQVMLPDTVKKRILDVGCGPVSMLLRADLGGIHSERARWSVGVDPLEVSAETVKRYEEKGINFLNMKAEDINPVDPVFRTGFDEVWMYNCLQHTDDPIAILNRITKVTKSIRIFEWIDLPPCPGHPQTLTQDMFEKALAGWTREIWNTGCLHGFGGTTTNRYIALWARKP